VQRYHPHARLTARGREALLRAVDEGATVTAACAAACVSRTTYYRWRRRRATEGAAGLGDRSSRPRCPRRALTAAQERRVARLRRARAWGPDRIAAALGLPRATVHRALRRLGLPPLRSRPCTAPSMRYERAAPGELLHVDTKKLGRITGGPGHRATGDRRDTVRGAGWALLSAAVDDASRAVYAEVLPDERGETAAGFLRRACAHFAGRGVAIQRVLTDNGSPFVSRAWRDACDALGAAPRRTRPYRPQTNGKVERWFQSALRECLYARPLASERDRALALRRFVRYYNTERPHLALRGRTPAQRLSELSTTLCETTASRPFLRA
jgi:transposase InsO family protein